MQNLLKVSVFSWFPSTEGMIVLLPPSIDTHLASAEDDLG
jgi:hypothetical protein